SAKNAKGEPIPGVSFETTIIKAEDSMEPVVNPAEAPAKPAAEPVDVFVQGSEARGSYIARGGRGEYRVNVVGKVNGQTIGEDSARFLTSQDDRELEPPTADPDLLAAIANTTGGKVLKPEELLKELKSIDLRQFSEFESQEERRLWDNWPMLLIFVALISAEWIIRRKSGMV
ncbi:MAG: hypothetical protein ACKO0V_21875, partial [bacterium]